MQSRDITSGRLVMGRPLLPLLLAGVSLLAGMSRQSARAQIGVRGWQGYAASAQHDAIAPTASQPLKKIHWRTAVDLMPPGGGVDIHYGSPLVTAYNTVVVTVKTGRNDGYKIEGRDGTTGTLLWTQQTDYTSPPHGWLPSMGSTLMPYGGLAVPGAGGTVYYRDNADDPDSEVHQWAFYWMENYNLDRAAFNNSVKINTPITSDSQGNLYFGFMVLGPNPLGLTSGIARMGADGSNNWIDVKTASGDAGMNKVVHDCAPALSQDESMVYIAVSNGTGDRSGEGYLLALNSVTLETVGKARPLDPKSGAPSRFHDSGTSSPTIGPDGDVFFGVRENPFETNPYRGWMVHYDGMLTRASAPGGFGWDDTPSIVPASAVPSYTGSSSYLILTKYNQYADGGWDGVNRVAILDPFDTMLDPLTHTTIMKEIITVAGVTPDDQWRDRYPKAVREWCINSAAVDLFTRSALINSEDGIIYRWDFTTNSLTEKVVLTAGVGEAYTPTIVGPDGTVYAINDAILFAVGDNQ